MDVEDRAKDGRIYRDPRILAKREARRHAVAIAEAHPTWNLLQVLDEQRKTYPNYTEAALRDALKLAGVQRSKPRPTGPRKFKEPTQRVPTPRKTTHRVAVAGYTGRSRMLSSYVEL